MSCDPPTLSQGVNRTVTESNALLFGGTFPPLSFFNFPSTVSPAAGSLKAHQVVIIRLLIKDSCLVSRSRQEFIFARWFEVRCPRLLSQMV